MVNGAALHTIVVGSLHTLIYGHECHGNISGWGGDMKSTHTVIHIALKICIQYSIVQSARMFELSSGQIW